MDDKEAALRVREAALVGLKPPLLAVVGYGPLWCSSHRGVMDASVAAAAELLAGAVRAGATRCSGCGIVSFGRDPCAGRGSG